MSFITDITDKIIIRQFFLINPSSFESIIDTLLFVIKSDEEFE